MPPDLFKNASSASASPGACQDPNQAIIYDTGRNACSIITESKTIKKLLKWHGEPVGFCNNIHATFETRAVWTIEYKQWRNGESKQIRKLGEYTLQFWVLASLSVAGTERKLRLSYPDAGGPAGTNFSAVLQIDPSS
jgi:hypothetical protein